MNSRNFEVTELGLPGVLLLKPKVNLDLRGFSAVSYGMEEFEKLGISTQFIQDYTSVSSKNVIRGLHFQKKPYGQDKLIRCSSGEIFDIIADCEPASPSYGKYVSAKLNAEEQTILYIPGKYAHGFCVTSDKAITEYKMSDSYHPDSADGIRWDDPFFGFNWPIEEPILSEQDASWPLLMTIAPNK